MTAVALSMQSAVPQENWDDDFEFHGPTSHRTSERTRMSTASSHVTEDWDREGSPARESRPPTTFIPHDSHFQHQWQESGPSTPPKRQRSQSNTTENWDDDFEDKTDSPAPKQITKPSSQQPTETWDAEFDIPASPSQDYVDDDDDSSNDDDNDLELGFADKEEDRTVTAGSRRAALSRLDASSQVAPPVPPIPFSLLSAAISLPSERPFPRSPTASVFSVPTVHSGRDSYYHNNSTTHLRPTISRSSIGGFANLPPSPPIHKERERRRLRKKSRPPESTFELAVRNPLAPGFNPSMDSFQQSGPEMDRRTPSPPAAPVAAPEPVPSNPRNSLSGGIPASPTNKSPLLSRIGSVKKWGARKKRASSTPSEVMLQESEQRSVQDHGSGSSSTSSTPASKQNWFFRASSGGGYAGSPPRWMGNKHEPVATADQIARGQERMQAPTASGSNAAPESPSKLVKRKSFGFVQIRRNNGPLNRMDDVPVVPNDLPPDLELELADSESHRKKRPTSTPVPQPRHIAYNGLGLGRAGATKVPGSTDSLTEQERDSRRSFSRSRSRDPAPEEREGSRFMNNVRKISMVGRHKRTKSGASLASVGEALQRISAEAPVDPYDSENEIDNRRRPPPIELQPPSPARVASDSTIRETKMNHIDNFLSPTSTTPLSTPLRKSPSPTAKGASSPQSASLGRSAGVPPVVATAIASIVPRRNSLGDLKIPARISQAQSGLRRDLGMVREFAANVEQLKDLQATYNAVVMEIQGILDTYAHNHQQQQQQGAPRSASPSFFNLPTPKKSRSRSNTVTSAAPPQPQPQQAYKQLASAFYTINSKYRITWECAELLIELGGGSTGNVPSSAPSTSASAPTMSSNAGGSLDGKDIKRGRAITLCGDDSKAPSAATSRPTTPVGSPPNPAWRASTGRHDLNQRQLSLLREMLNNPDSSFVSEDFPIPEEATYSQSTTNVNRDWRWGDAMNSTITLPSEESSDQAGGASSPVKKRRASRLGMSGLRDILRSLKRTQVVPPLPMSSTSISTDSSMESQNQHRQPRTGTYGRRRAKTSSGPESMRDRPNSPYDPSSLSKASPRRPSLASIFRLGQKSKVTPPASSSPADSSVMGDPLGLVSTRGSSQSNSTGEDEDWDRLDSAGDPVSPPSRDGFATVRGRSPYMQGPSSTSSQSPARPVTPKRSASASQTSLRIDPLGSATVRTTRLSNVEEHSDDHRTPQPIRRQSRAIGSPVDVKPRPILKSGSVRSMPPAVDSKLAMSPENIKPLLENAKEVHARLTECIAEVRTLLVEQHP